MYKKLSKCFKILDYQKNAPSSVKIRKASVIYYDAVDGYDFLTLIENSKTVQLNKNHLREWREITRQNQIDYGPSSKFNSHQKKIREREVSKNLVTINPGLISKFSILN